MSDKKGVDVLEAMEAAWNYIDDHCGEYSAGGAGERLDDARIAVAELMEAAQDYANETICDNERCDDAKTRLRVALDACRSPVKE